jgi:hypothetical protein
LPGLGLDFNPPMSPNWNYIHHHTWPVLWDRLLLTFFFFLPRLASNYDLPIFISQVSGIAFHELFDYCWSIYKKVLLLI